MEMYPANDVSLFRFVFLVMFQAHLQKSITYMLLYLFLSKKSILHL